MIEVNDDELLCAQYDFFFQCVVAVYFICYYTTSFGCFEYYVTRRITVLLINSFELFLPQLQCILFFFCHSCLVQPCNCVLLFDLNSILAHEHVSISCTVN